MKRIFSSFLRHAPMLFNAGFALFLVVTLALLVFVDKRVFYYGSENGAPLPNAVLFVFALLLAGCCRAAVWFFQRRARTLSDCAFYAALGMFFAALFALQLFITQRIYFLSGWDFGAVFSSAQNVAFYGTKGVEVRYFSMYPNNLFIACALVYLLRLGAVLISGAPYAFVLAITNLLVNLSVFLTVLCVYKLTKCRAAAVLSMLTGAVLIALSPWIVLPYTDSLTMVFPAAALFFYCFLKSSRLKAFFVTLFCVVGGFLKPTVFLVIFSFAAVAGVRTLKNNLPRKARLKRSASFFLSVGLSVLCALGLRAALLSTNQTVLDEKIRMPFSHFLMMGLNRAKNGVYYEDDVLYSLSFPDVKTRLSANLQVAGTRLREKGLFLLFVKKQLCNYNDGTFSWGLEGNFYLDVPPEKDAAATFLRSVYYNGAKNYPVFVAVQQTLWLFVLLCAAFSAFSLKTRSDASRVAMLAILLISAFLLLFECRARYLYLFSPLFFLLAGIGLSYGQKQPFALFKGEDTARKGRVS